MKTLNKVMLIGSCGRDPEVRSTAGGAVVANVSIATSERFKDKQGQWQETPEWHNLVAFGRTAEVIRDYVTKGSPIHVEGRLQTSSWEDKTSGQKRYKTEIVVDNLILLGGRAEGSGKAPRAASTSSAPSYSPFEQQGEIDESDIPF